MPIELKDCWAKTDPNGNPSMAVLFHCLSVGSVAETLEKTLPPSTKHSFPLGGILLIAAHDIGKISPGFLLKSQGWRNRWQSELVLSGDGYETRHAWIGQKFLSTLYSQPPRWLMAVGAHHGRYLCADAKPLEIFSKPIGSGDFEKLRNELFEILKERFGDPPTYTLIEKGARLHWFTGLMVFCDWIGSNTTWFPPEANYWSSEEITSKAAEAIHEVGIHSHLVESSKTFPDLFGFEQPRPLQKALIDSMDSSGLYIVEAPMGDGKTEAALAGAYRRWNEGGERGLYFALPTQLTSNRICDRVEEFIKRVVDDESSLALVHGTAWLSEKRIRPLDPQPLAIDGQESENSSESNRWFSDNRRAMLAPFGVGTIDQALMAVVPVKYSALRMFGLGGKVVVIDEVHSYDPFTSAFVDRLVNWLIEIGSTVIVLSATLTAARRASLVAAAGASEGAASADYPLVTKVAKGASLAEYISIEGSRSEEKQVSIQRFTANDERWMGEVTKAAQNGACVLVIRNTVALAQNTYRALKAHCLESGIEFGLIHSRFTQADRQQNETRWTNLLGRDGSARPKNGAVLVGTQVLEQSLDIDADMLVIDLAPTDLILQRIGRLHRHKRPRPVDCESPRCIIIRPEVDWKSTRIEVEKALSPHRFIYPPFALYMADRVWCGISSTSLPHDIRQLLESSAGTVEALPPAISEFQNEMAAKTEQMLQTASMQSIFKTPAGGDKEGVETRWNLKPTGWIVVLSKPPEECGHQVKIRFPCGTTHSFSDSVFDFALARLLQLHAVRTPAYLLHGIPRRAWLSNHLPDAIFAVRDDTNQLVPYPAPVASYNFRYSPQNGLEFSKTKPDTPQEDDSWY